MRIYRPQATKPIPSDAKIDRVKSIVTYKARGKTRRAVLTITDSGERMRLETSTWHIEFRDHLARKQGLPAFTHEGQTRFLASQIEKLIAFHGQTLPAELKEYCDRLPSRVAGALQDCGLLATEGPLAKPLSDLVEMYAQALRSKERNAYHIERTIRDLNEVLEGCAFKHWRDIKCEKVDSYLKDRRDGAVLRMNRHDKDGHPIGIGYARSNTYVTALSGFCNWVVGKRQWARESPLPKGMKLNASEDRRHLRRAITVEQLRALLQKTAQGPEHHGMTGYERYIMYRTAIETGLRAGELRRLRTSDFDLAAQTLTVRGMKATKNKTNKVQSLSPSLCAELRDFLGSKLPDAKAFGGSYAALTDKTADMIQEDLAAAGVRYKDDMGACFDFHALRGECATLLVESGVDAKQTQEVMRHSSITMTMDTYAKVTSSRRKAAAVAALPDLSLPGSEQQTLAKTGTDDHDATGESLRKVYADAPESLRKVYSQDEQDRTKPDSIGQTIPDTAPKTPLVMQDRGSGDIVVPRVEGSNPFSHPSQRTSHQARVLGGSFR